MPNLASSSLPAAHPLKQCVDLPSPMHVTCPTHPTIFGEKKNVWSSWLCNFPQHSSYIQTFPSAPSIWTISTHAVHVIWGTQFHTYCCTFPYHSFSTTYCWVYTTSMSPPTYCWTFPYHSVPTTYCWTYTTSVSPPHTAECTAPLTVCVCGRTTSWEGRLITWCGQGNRTLMTGHLLHKG